MSEVCTILLTHQSAEQVDRMLRYWDRITPRSDVFVAFGGSRDDFNRISHPHRALIDSPRLKTRDHQREKQSYAPVFQAAWESLKSQDCRYVHFIEYDHVPLVEDFHERMISFLEKERCDLAGFHVAQIDASSTPITSTTSPIHLFSNSGKESRSDLTNTLYSPCLEADHFGRRRHSRPLQLYLSRSRCTWSFFSPPRPIISASGCEVFANKIDL